MLSDKRQQIILDYLKAQTSATTQELCALTGASVSTLRRDLNSLSENGVLKRSHGGATLVRGSAAVSMPAPGQALVSSAALAGTPVQAADDPLLREKTAIARAALMQIHSGDTLFIGAGMTCILLCSMLAGSDLTDLHIVTTNVSAVCQLAGHRQFHTLLLGGTIHTGLNHIETLDEYTLQNLRSLYFDKTFFTVDGADTLAGYSIINRSHLPLYHYLLENAGEVWLLLDHSKFNKRTFTKLCPLEDIHRVITDAAIPAEYEQIYRQAGVSIITA